MKKFIAALVLGLGMVSSANADIILSTSASDANAGSNLNLGLGESGSMYVWVSTNVGQVINGLSIDVTSSDTAVLEATGHVIENPASRWFATGSGTLGDLIDDSNSITLVGGGLGTAGQSDYVLHSEVMFDATALGTTSLAISPGQQGISAFGEGDISGSINFGGGSVSVSAVPEPTSAAVLVGLASLVGLRRRRR